MGIEVARIINLRKMSDPQGNLTAIEGGGVIPFEIRRVHQTCKVSVGRRVGTPRTSSRSSSP